MDHGSTIKHETVKLLEDNIGGKPRWLWIGDDFLNTTPKAQSMLR